MAQNHMEFIIFTALRIDQSVQSLKLDRMDTQNDGI